MRNRTKILLLAALTLGLTAAAVGVAGYWYAKPSVITMAVGPESTPEHRFATKLAEVLAQSHASIRLKLVVSEAGAQNLSRFAHHEADLVVLRSDERRIPTFARAVAILEEQVLLLITPTKTKFRSLAELGGLKVAVVGRDGRNEAFFRRLLEQYKRGPRQADIRTVPPGTPLDTLLVPGGADLVVVLEPLSRLSGAGDFDDMAQKMKGFTVHPIEEAKALERKVTGLSAETVEAGLVVGAPRIPDDEIDTVALQRILVTRASLPDGQVVELMRALFESSRQLAVEQSFATRIEPPSTEKGALIAVHPGADQYVGSDVKTFFDRYSDLFYLGLSVAGVLGSGAAALYGAVFRKAPLHAGSLARALLDMRDRARSAKGAAELDAIDVELEATLDEVMGGLADDTLSPRGVEAFCLAYDVARDALERARRTLSPPRS